jgi:hypothetical protein
MLDFIGAASLSAIRYSLSAIRHPQFPRKTLPCVPSRDILPTRMSRDIVSSSARLASVTQWLSHWGLSAPVVFFLELHRPWAFVMGQLALFFQPFLNFIMSDQQATRFAQWLSTADGFDQLIRQLETEDPD